MAEIDNLILEHLRQIRGDVAALREDMREVKSRLVTLESGQGSTLQHLGHLASTIAQQQVSFDRLTNRV